MGIDNRSGDMIQVNNGTKEKPKKIEIPEETRIKKIRLIIEYRNDGEFDKFEEEIKKFINERLNFPNVSEDLYDAILDSFNAKYCDGLNAFLILCHAQGYTKKVTELDSLKVQESSGDDKYKEDLRDEEMTDFWPKKGRYSNPTGVVYPEMMEI